MRAIRHEPDGRSTGNLGGRDGAGSPATAITRRPGRMVRLTCRSRPPVLRVPSTGPTPHSEPPRHRPRRRAQPSSSAPDRSRSPVRPRRIRPGPADLGYLMYREELQAQVLDATDHAVQVGSVDRRHDDRRTGRPASRAELSNEIFAELTPDAHLVGLRGPRLHVVSAGHHSAIVRNDGGSWIARFG